MTSICSTHSIGVHFHSHGRDGSVVHIVSLVFDPQECVCIDGIFNLQHAPHGDHTCLHSHNGPVARILPYFFDPQEYACEVRSGLFGLHFANSALILHLSRSDYQCLNQQKFRVRSGGVKKIPDNHV
jgi:hypothetical protein